MKRPITMLLLLLPLLAAHSARAETAGHGAAGAHDLDHAGGPAHHLLVGLRGSSQMALVAEDAHGEGATLEQGVGLFAAWVANPGLEVELAGRMVFAEHHTLVPLELMFKHPFGHEALQPYVGAGPTLVLSTAEEADPAFGLSTVAGSYLWLTPRLGFLLEANYNLLLEEELTPELAVALGFVTAF